MAVPPPDLTLTQDTQAAPQQPQSLGDHLAPLATNAIEDFLVALLNFADVNVDGGLDSIFTEGAESVEQSLDEVAPEGVDSGEIDEREMQILAQKFAAIQGPERSQLISALQSQMPKEIFQGFMSMLGLGESPSQGDL
jgi:hypothetical protein